MWQNERTAPRVPGWYTVKRADYSLCVRAFGGGMWWIPLSDGWFGGLPPGFTWREPVVPMVQPDSGSPYNEMLQAAQQLGIEVNDG